MKHIFCLVLLIASLQLAHSQQANSWVYKVNYQATQQQADSVTFYTDVFMDVNPAAVFDSATLAITIGSNFGLGDIYSRSIMYTSNIINGNDITSLDGAIRFYLGKYVILPTSPFVVDMNILGKGNLKK